MKYVKEMVIIFGITLAGEVLNQLIPLPVPAACMGCSFCWDCCAPGSFRCRMWSM